MSDTRTSGGIATNDFRHDKKHFAGHAAHTTHESGSSGPWPRKEEEAAEVIGRDTMEAAGIRETSSINITIKNKH